MMDISNLTEAEIVERLSRDYFDRGLARFAQYDYVRAIHHFTQAIYIQPHNAEYYFERGNARRLQSDLTGAAEDYSAAIRFDPYLAEPYFRRAVIFKERFELEAAVRDYEMYLQLCDSLCAEDRAAVKQTVRDLQSQLAR